MPKFTEVPGNLTANAASSATFTCVTFAIPQPVTTWHRVSNIGVIEEIPGPHDNIYIDGNMLVIENVEYYRDRGIYTCSATNYVGSIEARFFFEVHGKKLFQVTEHSLLIMLLIVFL